MKVPSTFWNVILGMLLVASIEKVNIESNEVIKEIKTISRLKELDGFLNEEIYSPLEKDYGEKSIQKRLSKENLKTDERVPETKNNFHFNSHQNRSSKNCYPIEKAKVRKRETDSALKSCLESRETCFLDANCTELWQKVTAHCDDSSLKYFF